MHQTGASLGRVDGTTAAAAAATSAPAAAAAGQTRSSGGGGSALESGELGHALSDPLKNAGAFFGQTTLGATDPFFDAATTTQAYPFHQLPLDAYTAVFDRHALGAGSELAATFGFWFTLLDFDSNCLITRREWDAAVTALREASAHPQQAREYSSYDRWRADKLRERRVAWEPRRAFQAPLTAQQEIGWHAGKPAARLPSDRAKLSSTDVTRREGRTATTYYGYMNMLGTH
ncbi:hypothetical protein Rsub_12539 [Raphidocelis subcapitata]|uniref:EF-hand domain-containing protein n=1 Tax=Raphidocelis subcapitata TaxID=307507 RepID=A0A2V0PJX0_9CHLO|nr:hypothetical protein Rsub_12539 [Raphidocelis subcapitata]|eukprot:GBF99839.1 hypothetical protein Rsub_12539 [Raphidocelis subcapitata]